MNILFPLYYTYRVNQYTLPWNIGSIQNASHKNEDSGEVGIQGEKLYTAVLFWHFLKRDFCPVIYATVQYRILKTNVTFYKVPEKHGHFYLVGLYVGTLVVEIM